MLLFVLLFGGRCISNLRVADCVKESDVDFGKFTVTFDFDHDFNSTCLSVGDPIVISSMKPFRLALAVGYIVRIWDRKIVCSLDRQLKDTVTTLYRIDKDELSMGFGLLRSNILRLFIPENWNLAQIALKTENLL